MLIAGRYRLHTTLGRGAMGEVWRAHDEMIGRSVAVKLLLSQDADPTAAARFRLEAQTAGLLNHPHVVGVLDFGAYENRLFLVMELVEGDSLAHVLATAGTLPADRVARIAAQSAAGLAAAHQQNIVHRDIKPGNLLLDAQGSVKIGDFGIARFMDDPAGGLTATGQIVGTSLYLAPERALGKTAGPPSDMYSLGCVLYQLVTGRPPFQAASPVAVLHHHLDSAPTPPRELGADLPPAFENHLLSLLAKQPEDRPTALEAASWYGSDAWKGRGEPLPAAVQEPGRHRQDLRSAGPATTYALPSVARDSAGGHRSRRRRRPGVGELLGNRPRAVGAAAGVAVFLLAVLVGVAVFSPDSSSADTPGPQTSGTASTSPGATEPSASPAAP
ncbi:serine/threonine-protein kinase [Streptomyces sp. NPDC002580]|uniref:serine/threonine-protein kinase n=1 Tax=Streptomyces sp. NPDC002580 TaxID=3364653 RepID=UPI0036B9AFFF